MSLLFISIFGGFLAFSGVSIYLLLMMGLVIGRQFLKIG